MRWNSRLCARCGCGALIRGARACRSCVHCGVPELPEMQALSERLDALLAGATLEPADSLYGHDLVSVSRRAKYLVWAFDDGSRIVLHLSQAGRLDIEEPPKKTKPRGSVARFTFTTGGDSPSTVAV